MEQKFSDLGRKLAEKRNTFIKHL